MKVIVADKISDRGVELLKQTGWKIVATTNETLAGELADTDALIVRSATKVTADLLDKAPRLRVVGRAGVGVDNIDLDEATKRGVLVMSTPGGSSVSVAEHTFALLLALVRQVPKFDAAMREGRWEKSSSGAEVRGKTLGLFGLGRIGSEVARRAVAFDMRVLAFDPYISESAAKELSVTLVPMEQLLEDIPPPRDRVFDDLARELREGIICPVLIGSATRSNGVLRLMKALRHEAPGIAETCANPGAALDDDPMAMRDQLARGGWDEPDPVFAILDFLRYSNEHCHALRG